MNVPSLDDYRLTRAISDEAIARMLDEIEESFKDVLLPPLDGYLWYVEP